MANEGEVAAALRRAYGAIDDSLDATGAECVEMLEKATDIPYPGPSAPHSPPHRRSGQLNEGFRHHAQGRALSIWNTAPHFKWLEGGTSKMAPRPTLATVARTYLVARMPVRLSKDIVKAERKR